LNIQNNCGTYEQTDTILLLYAACCGSSQGNDWKAFTRGGTDHCSPSGLREAQARWAYVFLVFYFLRPVAVSTAATCFIYRTSTGEAWQMIMMDCGREETMCDERSDTPDQSCGSFWFSIIYFITFYILCSFLVSTTVVHDDAQG